MKEVINNGEKETELQFSTNYSYGTFCIVLSDK